MTRRINGVRHVALLGLMGAGKSTVGHELAVRTGWRLSDSDREITAKTGRTVRELRDAIGVDAMHDLESEHLLLALASDSPSVICAAASTVDSERCCAALRDPTVLTVWLQAAPAALNERFATEAHRPSYGANPAQFLSEQLARRGHAFASVADLSVDTTGCTPSEIVDEIALALAAMLKP